MDWKVLVYSQLRQIRIRSPVWDSCNLPIHSNWTRAARARWKDAQNVPRRKDLPWHSFRSSLGKVSAKARHCSRPRRRTGPLARCWDPSLGRPRHHQTQPMIVNSYSLILQLKSLLLLLLLLRSGIKLLKLLLPHHHLESFLSFFILLRLLFYLYIPCLIFVLHFFLCDCPRALYDAFELDVAHIVHAHSRDLLLLTATALIQLIVNHL